MSPACMQYFSHQPKSYLKIAYHFSLISEIFLKKLKINKKKYFSLIKRTNRMRTAQQIKWDNKKSHFSFVVAQFNSNMKICTKVENVPSSESETRIDRPSLATPATFIHIYMFAYIIITSIAVYYSVPVSFSLVLRCCTLYTQMCARVCVGVVR